jgi:predicted metal-dependent hydrolase
MDAAEREATLEAAIDLFDGGSYLAAHELFEELWEDTHGGESAFFQGLLQAAVALHHLGNGNRAGAEQLHAGARRSLAAYLPRHADLDLARFLVELRAALGPGATSRPRLRAPESRPGSAERKP